MPARTWIVTVAVFFAAAGAAQAEKITIRKMHICCGGCVKGIEKAIAGIDVEAAVDQDTETATLEGTPKTIQKALNALAAAGYHGETDNSKFALPEDSGAPAGKVTRLEVTNAHNCCGACTRAIKDSIAQVPGVQADTCKPKEPTFVVEGNFDAAALVKALNEAGFHVTVK